MVHKLWCNTIYGVGASLLSVLPTAGWVGVGCGCCLFDMPPDDVIRPVWPHVPAKQTWAFPTKQPGSLAGLLVKY